MCSTQTDACLQWTMDSKGDLSVSEASGSFKAGAEQLSEGHKWLNCSPHRSLVVTCYIMACLLPKGKAHRASCITPGGHTF